MRDSGETGREREREGCGCDGEMGGQTEVSIDSKKLLGLKEWVVEVIKEDKKQLVP